MFDLRCDHKFCFDFEVGVHVQCGLEGLAWCLVNNKILFNAGELESAIALPE